MSTSLLVEIEQKVRQLPRNDQLWLIERLVHGLRQESSHQVPSLESQLAAMAADPEIRKELQAINAEFSVTESDGLE